MESHETGLFLGLPAEEYHRNHLGLVSKSGLDQVNRSPAHYRAWVEQERERETPALVFGKAFHMAVLEPERFAEHYVVAPDFGDCRFKENKAARDAWRVANAFKIEIPTDSHETILRITDSIAAHPMARTMIRGGHSEVSCFWQDDETRLPCKCRADYYIEQMGLIVDLKTTENASESEFKRSVANYRYHVQDAVYRAGFLAVGKPVWHFAFIAVEKTAPYAVAVYTLDVNAIATGHGAARRNIETIAECVRTAQWPGYSSGIVELDLPKWAA